MMYASLPLICLFVGASLSAPEHVPSTEPSEAEPREHSQHNAPLQKRSPHYNFDLGKRAYTYVSEYKRLPVYNFGLGKRAPLYSFGLGKRSVDNDDLQDDEYTVEQEALAELIDQYEDPAYEVKRARPYSFGLGKRYLDESSEYKRAKMYEFGLGKRLPLYNFGLGKRSPLNYNFGLGKRLAKYNFGLGKRQRELSRFSFGLGKRSDDFSPADEDNDES